MTAVGQKQPWAIVSSHGSFVPKADSNQLGAWFDYRASGRPLGTRTFRPALEIARSIG